MKPIIRNAARSLGLDPEWFNKQVSNGKIKIRAVGGGWAITISSAVAGKVTHAHKQTIGGINAHS